MKDIIRGAIVSAALALVGSACESEETLAEAPPAPETTATESPPETTTVLAPEPAVPGIVPRVKVEIDNREDGAAGDKLTASGVRAVMHTPEAWSTTRDGAFQRAKDESGKAELAIGNDTGRLSDAVAALGLSDCRWAPSETVSVGKDHVTASAADGLCKKDGVDVPAAQLSAPDLRLLAVGVWQPGGDDAGLFATLRSVTRVAGGGGGGGISACCDVLAQNRKSAPPEQQGYYDAAIGTCRSLQSNPQGRQLLSMVRAALQSANVPPACR